MTSIQSETVTITDSGFISNSAFFDGGGAAIFNDGALPVHISDSGFFENEAENGGGLLLTSFVGGLIEWSIFADNWAEFEGAGLSSLTARL